MNDNSIINEILISRDNLELYKNETDKKIRNHVENKISENIDETLTKSGFSADSSVVGEKIDEINGSISTLSNEINQNKTDILTNKNDIKDLQTATSLNAKVIFSFNFQRTGKYIQSDFRCGRLPKLATVRSWTIMQVWSAIRRRLLLGVFPIMMTFPCSVHTTVTHMLMIMVYVT